MPKPKHRTSNLPILLGSRIKERRVELAMTQADLAEKLGVYPETVSRIERGAALPSLLRLEEIADILKVSAGSLVQSSSTIAGDLAQQIAALLKPLDEHDRVFVLEYVKKFSEHRKSRAKR